ncbi:MFS transporter [Clostridium sp. YIM B02515]|uniref:MFS transporter n=2 Tax=Clostridium rhizosphaerae TaxID=2803861 RepID=A0ABS1T544_9CLOT|nr:MFS transporter [Clostridium rhizosphaerae]MBL4934227.1 MFS transporter [Clostridium rhizosphaerae]
MWLIAAVYLLGLFMGAIDTGIVTPARTIIQNNLMVDDKTGIWMITIYTLAYASSIPIMGKLADKFGRKYVYLTAIFLFGTGSLLCGLSQNFGSFSMLLVARVVQAIGGGGIVPIATAEFGTTFPPEKRGMALGLVGGVYGIANIFGSSAGSAILDIFGKNNWQFIFYINVPITIFIIITGLLVLRNNKSESVSKIDTIGILLLICMILSLLYGLKNIDFFNFSESIKSTSVYPFIITFVVLLPFFVLAEKKAEDPVMNLGYFTNPRIVIIFLISFITGIVLMGTIFIPQFSENAMKITSGSGGYFVIILGLFAGVGAPISGRLSDKFGAKKVLIFGFTISLAGSAFLIFVTTRYPGLATVVISLMLIGLGMGFTIGAPLNYMMLENTKKEESNSALAALSLIRSIGTTIAPAIMVGFIAHAGGAVQTNEMALLPKEVTAPQLPYAQELNDKLNKLKSDPNMKDKMAGLEFPDLSTMTKVEINMKGDGSTKLPEDLIELLKTSDVTNITERIKILSSRMFKEMTPDVIAKIQNGIQKGIDGIQSGIPEMDKSIADLKAGAEGVTNGINGMKSAVAGMDKGITQMKKAISSQETAIVQLNGFYDQMVKMMSQSGPPQGAVPQGGAPQGNPTGTQTGGKMPAVVGNVSIVDMIPQDVKAKMPASALEQLKDVKTPADLKAKIQELTNAKKTLTAQVDKLTKQRKDMLAKITETEGKHKDMLNAISSIEAAKADMNDTLNKMTVLKEAVPKSFEEANNNYLAEIDKLSPKIESEFQETLNVGFRQIYLTTGIAALAALIILAFYRKKEYDEESKAIAE